MGNFFGKKRYRVLMLGLDNAGKTSIVQRLCQQELTATVPTVGFVVETITIEKTHFTVWDVGGQDKIRPLWRHYFTGSQGLIFVVDSNDRERLDEAAQEFHKVIQTREMRHVAVLIFCNKQDIANTMKPNEIQQRFHLEKFHRPYVIMPCSASEGTGLVQGLKWLSKHCK